MNDAGTAVGTLFDDPHGSAPFVYADGVLTVLPSVPTAAETSADAINDAGQTRVRRSPARDRALGWCELAADPNAGAGRARDPRHERLCQIVGAHHPDVFFKPHAFLIANGVGVDLNSQIPAGSGWRLGTANAINDAGEIAGVGRHHGKRHAFLATGPGRA